MSPSSYLFLNTAAAVVAVTLNAPVPLPLPPFETPFGSSSALDINNRGEVVGTHTDVGAFVWSARGFEPLGLTDSFSIAIGNNKRGDVVGLADDGTESRAFLRTSAGTFTDVSVPGALRTVANDVNNRRTIVGYFVEVLPNTDERVHGFVLSASGLRVLDNPFGEFHTAAESINEAGTIVGWFGGDQDSPKSGFILQDESWTIVEYPGADSTWLTGIATNGAIVGYAFLPDQEITERGFVYRDGAFQDLAPGFIPQGINDSGAMVGSDGRVAMCVSNRRNGRCP
jgi:hypothetical protein